LAARSSAEEAETKLNEALAKLQKAQKAQEAQASGGSDSDEVVAQFETEVR
jgi:hypothetical protein